MKFYKEPKFRLYTLIGFLLAFVLLLTAFFSLYGKKRKYSEITEKNIAQEVEQFGEILKIHNRNNMLKIIVTDRVLNKMFTSSHEITEMEEDTFTVLGVVKNTGEASYFTIKKIFLGDKELYKNTNFPSEIRHITDSYISVWQKIDDGYLRITSNLPDATLDGTLPLFIYNTEDIVQTVERGESYTINENSQYDRLRSIYSPIYIDGEIKGIIQISVNEGTAVVLNKLFKHKTNYIHGFPFYINQDGTPFIGNGLQRNFGETAAFLKMRLNKNSVTKIPHTIFDGKKQISGYLFPLYSKDISGYVGIFMPEKDLNSKYVENRNTLILILILSGAIIYIFALLILKFRYRFIQKLSEITDATARGQNVDFRYQNADIDQRKILTNIETTFNKFSQISYFIKQLRNKSFDTKLPDFYENSEIITELYKLKTDLKKSEIQAKKIEEQEAIRQRVSEGNEKITEILYYTSDVDQMSYKIISTIVSFLNLNQGGIFFLNNDKENEPFLQLTASFAYDKKRIQKKEIPVKTGLTGRCVLEKQTIYLNEIPDDYTYIQSGFGQALPRSLALIPLIFNKEVYGVIEVAGYNSIEPYMIEFIEKTGENIASTYASIKGGLSTANVLRQTRQQSEAMKKREELLLRKIKNLSREKKKAAEKVSLSLGVLEAFQSAVYSSEYSADGTILHISPKLTQLLDIDSTEIIGKNHNQITKQDINSGKYIEIWKNLNSGHTQSFVEEISVDGKSSTLLNQTFTPIKDRSGEVVRIFSISFDLTGELAVQKEISKKMEALSEQERVLKSQVIDIQQEKELIDEIRIRLDIFATSMDRAFLRIDYSTTGDVLDVNKRFTEVTGFSKKELLGTNVRNDMPKSEQERFNKTWNDVLQGIIRNEKITILSKDRKEIVLLKSDIPLINEDGKIVKIMFVAFDITDINIA